MRIEEFLLSRVDEDEKNAAEGAGGEYELGPNGAHAASVESFEHRRAVIHRHHDRSVTVMASGAFETVTRCGICIHEFTRPCRALRTLAVPDDQHPDYDRLWQLAAPGSA